ncbi:MAG: hypothetical protein SFU56_00695 [Capsulimonadales bacterium]|nr:hypothetical protein [Capsulimonadales bacterium]
MAVISVMDAGRKGNREGSRDAGREISRVQVFKHVTKDRLIDVGDMLHLESRRSKIAFTLVAFDENFKSTVRVRHYADVSDIKLVCWDILHGTFSEWTDYKGSSTEEGTQARVMTLRKDPKYRQPFVIKIDNGRGETMPGGAVKMVQATDTLTLLLSEWDARRMAATIYDYIRDWETVHFRRRQEAQTIILAGSDGPAH